VKDVVGRIDGRRLLAVEAVGKNLLLRFEGGVTLRSHLRMKGRWSVVPRGSRRVGKPWLILRGSACEAVLWNGPVLEFDTRRVARLGPDILGEPPRYDAMIENLRGVDQTEWLGDALLNQRLVAGIGNLWKAEALWHARVSPWRRVRDVSDGELREVLEAAHELMRASVDGRRGRNGVYRRVGRPCPRCGTRVRSWPQGEGARMAYWCDQCQRGDAPKPSVSATRS
jgi:endonuclease-8